MPNNQIKMTFANVGGIWRRVDSPSLEPQTLAEVLKEIEIIVDDDTEYCRIIRYYKEYEEHIIYKTYGGHTTITINKFYRE